MSALDGYLIIVSIGIVYCLFKRNGGCPNSYLFNHDKQIYRWPMGDPLIVNSNAGAQIKGLKHLSASLFFGNLFILFYCWIGMGVAVQVHLLGR